MKNPLRQRLWRCQLSLWESWHGEAVTERAAIFLHMSILIDALTLAQDDTG